MHAVHSAIRPAIQPAICSAFVARGNSLASQVAAIFARYPSAKTWWLEPGINDGLTFQDSAGTTPVTAYGQTVGLVLSKATAGQRGGEVWSDPTAVFHGESSRVSPGVYRILSTAGAFSGVSAAGGGGTVGVVYEVSFVIDSISAGGVSSDLANSPVFTTPGPKVFRGVGLGANFIVKRTGVTDAVVSNVSCRQIPGTHFIQTTATARPAIQLNAAGYPTLVFGGVDDFLVSAANVDMTGTDKVTRVAGLRKLSDAATGMIEELSVNLNSNNGTFYLLSPNGANPNAAFVSKGTAPAGGSGATVSGLPAPTSRVLTGIGDIGGDISTLRVSGTAPASNATDQGTGNYGSYPLYIGMRAGTSLPFNGELSVLQGIGAQLTAAEISTLERYAAMRQGVVL